MIVIMILAPAQIGTMSCSHSCSSMRSSTCFSRRPWASWMPSPLHLSCQVWRATGPSFAPHLVSPSRSFSAWVSLVMQQSKKTQETTNKKETLVMGYHTKRTRVWSASPGMCSPWACSPLGTCLHALARRSHLR